jgi:hypothetical protein
MTKQTRGKRAIRNCNSKDEQYNDKTDKKEQSEDVIQRTNNTMTKQTRDKRAIRNCNAKDGEYNDKTDKGQKSNQKM